MAKGTLAISRNDWAVTVFVAFDLLPKRVQEKHAFDLFDAEIVRWNIARQVQAAIPDALRFNGLVNVFRLECPVIRGRAGHEPRIAVGCGKNPALPKFVGLVFPGHQRGLGCLLVRGHQTVDPDTLRGAEQVISAGIKPMVWIGIWAGALRTILRSTPYALIGPAEFGPHHHVV